MRPLKIKDLENTHKWRNNIELIKLTQGIRFLKTLEIDKDWFLQTLNDKSSRNIYFDREYHDIFILSLFKEDFK